MISKLTRLYRTSSIFIIKMVVASIPELTFGFSIKKAWNDVLVYLTGGIAKRLTEK